MLFAVTVLMVLVLNRGVWSRFLPNEFVKAFVVVDSALPRERERQRNNVLRR